MTTRYAVYFVPDAKSTLGHFGRQWLGWDICAGAPIPMGSLPGFNQKTHADIIGTPARYGFHATLKAPLRLNRGVTVDSFLSGVETLANRLAPVTGIPLALSQLGHFLALTPTQQLQGLAVIANTCVRDLDIFRAPLKTTERQRRRPESLSSHQRNMLDLWGYPYVLDEYRFHMTLTNKLNATTLNHVTQLLSPILAPILSKPMVVDAITVVVQRAPGDSFRLLRRFPLRGAAASTNIQLS